MWRVKSGPFVEIGLTDLPKSGGGGHVTPGTPGDDRPEETCPLNLIIHVSNFHKCGGRSLIKIISITKYICQKRQFKKKPVNTRDFLFQVE